jgi:hypothetical protein
MLLENPHNLLFDNMGIDILKNNNMAFVEFWELNP